MHLRGKNYWPAPAPGGILFADKAYDTGAIRAKTAERSALANVPSRVTRKTSSQPSSSQRHVSESRHYEAAT